MLALIASILLIKDIPIANYLYAVEKDRLVKSLERDAFVMGLKSEEAIESPTAENLIYVTQLIRDYSTQSSGRVVITNISGVAVAISDDDQGALGDSYLSRPEVSTALRGEIATGQRFSKTLNQSLMFVSVPIYTGERIVGSIRITHSNEEISKTLKAKLLGLLLVALFTVLISIIIGVYYANSITRNLVRLRNDVREFAEGKLSTRTVIKGNDPEIKDLAESFNSMAEKISRLISDQKMFSEDVSHQLRTPLTALRLKMENAEDVIHTDWKRAQVQIHEANNEISRLLQLTEDLLRLTRTETTFGDLVVEDLVQIVTERMNYWTPFAEENGVSLEYSLPDHPEEIRTLSGATVQVLDNYIDNAFDVTAPGGKITVRVERFGDYVELHVIDSGCGLSDADKANAFNRFWRSGTHSKSTGLGLAIVSRLMLSAGGSAELRDSATGGIDACARFKSAQL